jgi:hypothetical protein
MQKTSLFKVAIAAVLVAVGGACWAVEPAILQAAFAHVAANPELALGIACLGTVGDLTAVMKACEAIEAQLVKFAEKSEA